MESTMNQTQIKATGMALAAAALLTGCSLDVTNLNQPDRERALAQSADVEALIAGTFNPFFSGVHGITTNDGYIINYYPTVATEMTTTTATGRAVQANREPRAAYNMSLSIGGTGEWGPRYLWRYLNQMAASAHEGLQIIDDSGKPLVVNNQDVTVRARAFAKLMQGIGWGYQAMLYDQAVVIPQNVPLTSKPPEILGRENLVPWEEALQKALGSIEEAIALAQTSNFSFPSYPGSRLWFGSPEVITRDKFVQYANTMAARILVLSARTPQTRAALDWDRVLRYTAAGLTTDLDGALATGFRSSLLFSRSQNNPAGCESCFRLDNRMIGPSDISGAYQQWVRSPVEDRNRFNIVTPDRRITGTTPTSNGSYTRYRADNNGFNATNYLFSAYQWGRHAIRNNSSGTAANIGNASFATADENRLLRAEALYYKGDTAGSASLVNVTRTRTQRIGSTTHPGLPPVTASGVPQSADCVPRTDSGACGNLLVALRYERMVELTGLDAVRGYADSRGFGILPEGTWLHLPPPPEELNMFGLPIYTYGGTGTEWGAKYAPVGNP
jgi:hypothetical protein